MIYTSDGKEYLTNEQLEREIRDVLAECGGRLLIADLPGHLNVHADIAEKSAEQYVKKNKGVSLINGHLISRAYVDAIIEEVYEMLSD